LHLEIRFFVQFILRLIFTEEGGFMMSFLKTNLKYQNSLNQTLFC